MAETTTLGLLPEQTIPSEVGVARAENLDFDAKFEAIIGQLEDLESTQPELLDALEGVVITKIGGNTDTRTQREMRR